MKLKNEHIILGAIIIALTLYLALNKNDRSFYDLPDIPGINTQDITKIEITKNFSSITLNKNKSDWHIAPEDYLADKDKITAILDIIEKLSLTALVSESKNYEIYDLGDDKKITVKAWASDGSLKREFEVGKTAESYRHTHVKLPQDHRVYHASTNFRPPFDITMENLRDKQVLSFNKDEIKEIAFIKKGKTYRFTKKEPENTANQESPPNKNPAINQDKNPDKKEPIKPPAPVWEYTGKGSVDQKRLENILEIVSQLKCDKFIYNKQKDDLKYPVLTLSLKGNQIYGLKIFSKNSKDDKNRPCISSGSTQPFEIPDYQATLFMESLLENKGSAQ